MKIAWLLFCSLLLFWSLVILFTNGSSRKRKRTLPLIRELYPMRREVFANYFLIYLINNNMEIVNISYNLTQNTGDYKLTFIPDGGGEQTIDFPNRQFPLYLDLLKQQPGFFNVVFTTDNVDDLIVYTMGGVGNSGVALSFVYGLAGQENSLTANNELKAVAIATPPAAPLSNVYHLGIDGALVKEEQSVAFTFLIPKNKADFNLDYAVVGVGCTVQTIGAVATGLNWLVTVKLFVDTSPGNAPAALVLTQQP